MDDVVCQPLGAAVESGFGAVAGLRARITVTATFHLDPRIAGTDRSRLVVSNAVKRRRGRPYGEARLLRDRLVGHVQHLEGAKLEAVVQEVAAFHGVGRSTVFRALAEHDPDAPIDVGYSTYRVGE
jgi:hypothetical protein